MKHCVAARRDAIALRCIVMLNASAEKSLSS